ncbi:MAG: hypothetical protein AB1813_02100 [Verrucomicrobiota bacterium]
MSLAPVQQVPSSPMPDREKRFDWPLCYEAENCIIELIDSFLARNSFARNLAAAMRNETGTLFIDWVDYLELGADAPAVSKLSSLGYQPDPHAEPENKAQSILWHPEAMLPRIIIGADIANREAIRLAIHVDHLADFMTVHGLSGEPKGDPLSRFRRLVLSEENGARFEVVERRGYRGFNVDPAPSQISATLKAHELWRTRRRTFSDETEGFADTMALLDRVVSLVGRDLACHIVFAEERAYWERRNRAAQIQKQRQDRLGLGWANHDHHTFRCSRRHFIDLMQALEKLGFERRERYYAGAQAGWGAQILEQPIEGIVAFCDVDLEPHETEIDFSRQPLPPSHRLGTIGLWVGLHGESFLEAGMHHLECRFDHALLRDQLAVAGVATMKPFSDFPFLKQAFTEGERWPVRRERAEKLCSAGLISRAQCEKFVAEGAIGSHLENLQRKGGFKGFNQKSVSVIIEATDPLKG